MTDSTNTSKKNDREPRLANIIEYSRAGEKVIGQIDKDTGEITGAAGQPKPVKAPKAADSEK